MTLRSLYYHYADTPGGRASTVATIFTAFALALSAQSGSSTASQQANPGASTWQTIVTPDRDCTNDALSPDMHLVACSQILMDYLRGTMAMPVDLRRHMNAVEDVTRRFQTGEVDTRGYIRTLARHTPEMVTLTGTMDRSISDFVQEYDDLVRARLKGKADERWRPTRFIIE